MKKLLFAFLMLFSALTYSESAEAQNITVSGLSAGCFGSAPNGTYTRQAALVNGKYRYNGPSGFYVAWSGGTFSTASYGTIGPAWRLYGGPAPGAHYHCLVNAGIDIPCATPSSPFTEQWRGDYGCGSITVAGSGCASAPQTVTSFGSPTNATLSNVRWQVNFSGPVTGLTPSNFSISGTAPGTTITAVTGSGSTWYVHVNTGSGTGSIGLSMNSSGSTALGNLPFASSLISKTSVVSSSVSSGDIAFSSYISDLGDRFSFVAVVDIPANQTIYFTDHGWNGNSWGTSTSEGIIQWSHTAMVTAGTQVEITGLAASVGTVTNKENATSGLNLSTSGDQIIAFQGQSTSGNMIAGVHYSVYTSSPVSTDAGWDNSNSVTSSSASNKPPGLTTGTNAMRAGVEFDNGKVNCTGLPVTSAAALRTYLNNDANWGFDNDLLFVGNSFPSCTFLASPCSTSASITAQTNVLCNGASTGSATVTPSGGTTPYTYSWTGGGGTSATTTSRAAGAYTVTITDAASCTATTSVTITQPSSALSGSITAQTNVGCNGASTGSATVTASGGTSGYTYSWTGGGGSSATTTGRAAGAYTVTITDANSCTATTSVTITQPTALSGSITAQTNVGCNGASTGSATVTASGGTSGYTYSWTGGGGTSATTTGRAAGAYTVTITDANSCTATTSVTITQPASAVSGSITAQTNVLCFGASTGSATVTASGGTSGYTYSWTGGGGSSATTTGRAAGAYTVTVTDANSCTATTSVTITQPASAVSASTTADSNATCIAGGGATATPSGGTGPYTYLWSNADTTASITGITPGTYTVTISDANSCTATSSVAISAAPIPSVAASLDSNATCSAGGGATATPSGGTSPYTYAWSNLASTASITGVVAGTYTVTITDANSCTATSSVTITGATVIVGVTPANPIVCAGAATGTSMTASGATTYAWSPATGLNTTTGATVVALPSVTTTYTVIGTTGTCNDTTTVTVTLSSIDSIVLTASPQNICVGGSSSLTAMGCESVPGGGVFISEITGCDACAGASKGTWLPASNLEDPVEITNSTGAPVDMSGWKLEQTVSCTGSLIFPPGTIVAPNSTFVIQRGNSYTGPNIPGVYLSTLALGNNCAQSSSAIGFILSDAGGTVIDVVGYNNASVVGTGSPAAPPGSWAGTMAGSTGGSNGIRRVAADDTDNVSDWVISSASSQTNYGALNTAFTTSIVTCDTNGTAMLYAWSPSTYLAGVSGNTNTATAVTAPITYTVTAFNTTTGCVASDTISLTQIALGSVTAMASANTICELDTTQLTATISGGVAPFTYSWSPSTGMPTGADATSNPKASPSATTTYTVTVTDGCSTTVTSSVTITVNPNPVITATATDSTVCEGSTTDLNVTGNATTYVWNPGSLSGALQTVTPTATTLYTVTGTITATGCTTDASVPITFIPTFYDTVSVDLDTICIGQSVNLIAGDSIPPVLATFDLYSFANSTGATLDPMTTGATTIISTSVDDTPSPTQSIGFNFNYDGTAYTQFKVTPDGFLALGLTGGSDFSNSILFPNGGISPMIFPYWDDLATGTSGAVKMKVSGTAPNRILIVDWFVTAPRSTGGAANANFQAWLYEGTDVIEFRYGAASPGTSSSASVGLGGASPTPIQHYQSVTISSNTSSSTSANNSNTALPTAGTMYTFTPPAPPAPGVYTYTWNPGSLTGAAQTVSPTSTTTYVATQTDANGCTAQDSVLVHVNIPSIIASALDSVVCAGDTVGVLLTATGGVTYTWSPTAGLTPATGDSVMAAPTAGTTYTVTGTDANGCIDTDAVTIEIAQVDSVSALASPVNVCPNGNSELTAQACVI